MQESILYIISVVAGFAGMPLIDLIKKSFGVAGNVALLIAALVSILLAFVVVIGTGQLPGGEVTLEAVVNSTTLVFGVATVFYKAFHADK